MYCEFCGQKVLQNAKYCRHCGQQLSAPLDDTQPVPIITETLLQESPHRIHIPWHKAIIPRKPVTKRTRFGQLLYDAAAFTFITALLYILVTFKTIWDYQVLTALWGGGILLYIWWKH